MRGGGALDRRRLLGRAGLGAAAVALPGCATTGTRSAAKPACLAPVNASPDRVIRTLAGLRPFRPAGFRVEREAFGAKALVHNYGHGGSGVTLSWGTSRLAVELGLPGHAGPVAVLGAGIVGLTTARLVQEAGLPVTIYAAALSPDTTSNISGGQVHAYGHADEDAVTPAYRAQFERAYDYACGASRSWSATTTASAGCPPTPRATGPWARTCPASACWGRASIRFRSIA